MFGATLLSLILWFVLLEEPLGEAVSCLVTDNLQRRDEVLRDVPDGLHGSIGITAPHSDLWIQAVQGISIFFGDFHKKLLINQSRHDVVVGSTVSMDHLSKGLCLLLESFCFLECRHECAFCLFGRSYQLSFSLLANCYQLSLGLFVDCNELALSFPFSCIEPGISLDSQSVTHSLSFSLLNFGFDRGSGKLLGSVLLGLLECSLDFDVLLQLHLNDLGIIQRFEIRLLDDKLLFSLNSSQLSLRNFNLLLVAIFDLLCHGFDASNALPCFSLPLHLSDVTDFVLFSHFHLSSVFCFCLDTLTEEREIAAAFGI